MFKRIIHILLAVSVCISLFACSDTPTNGGGTQQSTVEGDVYSVMIKINPQFEVVLNNERFIVQINYLNKDAKQAFSDVNVLSDPFDEGVLKLLNTLYSKGYIKDNTLQIAWAVQDIGNTGFDFSIIEKDFEKVITEFSDKNNISVSVSMANFNDFASQIEQQVDIIDGIDPEDEWESLDNITIERDANGNIVKYIETDTEGNQSIYNAQKQLIRQLLKTENGYMEVNYDENGQIIENDDRQTVDEWELSDNITIERDPDGNVLRYIETDSKGSKVIYNAQKQRVYASINHDDANEEIYYDENGNITKDIFHCYDDSEMEIFRYANGNKERVYILFGNGDFTDEYYSESGDCVKRIIRSMLPNGAYQIDYDTDCNGNTDYQYVYETDGSVWYNEFDKNGNQIGQKQVQ